MALSKQEKEYKKIRLAKIQERILNAFENPENWPITDTERIELLRRLYREAKELKDLQAYERQNTPSRLR